MTDNPYEPPDAARRSWPDWPEQPPQPAPEWGPRRAPGSPPPWEPEPAPGPPAGQSPGPSSGQSPWESYAGPPRSSQPWGPPGWEGPWHGGSFAPPHAARSGPVRRIWTISLSSIGALVAAAMVLAFSLATFWMGIGLFTAFIALALVGLAGGLALASLVYAVLAFGHPVLDRVTATTPAWLTLLVVAVLWRS